MYKYFKELENPNSYSVNLIDNLGYSDRLKDLNINGDYEVRDINIQNSFYEKYSDVFKRLKFVDMLVCSYDFNIYMEHLNNLIISNEEDYQMWMNIGDFIDVKEEWIENQKNFLSDLKYGMRNYEICINFLLEFFPNYHDFLTDTQNMIINLRKELYDISTIEMPSSFFENKNIKYTFPNAFYITPSGYLHNTGGKMGHKSSNFIDLLVSIRRAVEALDDGQTSNISKSTKTKNHHNYERDYVNQTNDILNRGYVTDIEFQSYANLVFQIPTVVTPEILDAELKHKIARLNNDSDYFMYVNDKRTYQSNIVKLVVGCLMAHHDVSVAFNDIEKSPTKLVQYRRLLKLINNDVNDLLVRFCNFSKVESTRDRVITTSSLTYAHDFEEYIKNDFDIEFVPPIIYDKYLDKIDTLSLDSVYLNKYLEKEEKYYKKIKKGL